MPASDPRFSFLVPTPDRKAYASDEEYAERMRRHAREKTGMVRVRAKKLRGVFSMGLLTPCPPGKGEGDDVAELLGVEKYEPDADNAKVVDPKAERKPGPRLVETCPLPVPVYDLEALRRNPGVLQDGEEVVITEKIHGQNARYVHDGSRLYCGSHYQWKAEPRTSTAEERGAYWRAMRSFKIRQWFVALYVRFALLVFELVGYDLPMPRRLREPVYPVGVPMSNWWHAAILGQLASKLHCVPRLVVYGEVYGPCQDLKYGSPDVLKFRAFDAFNISTGKYLDYDAFIAQMRVLEIETVPLLYRGPWSDELKALAEGKTTLGGGHVREGIVIRTAVERTHPGLGRVVLKLTGQGYLLRE